MLNSPPAPILIGHEGQLTVLRAFSARVASGRAGALLLRGDAGGGQDPTRHRARRRSARERASTVLVGGCVALGDEPLRHAALIELLRAASQTAVKADDPRRSRGSPTEQVLERLLAVVDDVARVRPARARVEDIHWADQGTCEILTVLARHVADRPVGLVMTCREELPARPPRPPASSPSSAARQLVTPVAVPPLTPAEVARLVEACWATSTR